MSEYEQFIAAVKAAPDKVHYPSPEADKVWHRHILDTKAYHEFCMSTFGKFLHHAPDGGGYCAATLEK